MIPGLQTHIEGWTDPSELRFAFDNRFRLARISAMTCSAEEMLRCVNDAKAAGFRVLVTLADAERIRLLSPGDIVECRNEDDGDITPASYRQILDEFCRIGQEVGVAIGGPTCSNTNAKCVRWATAVRGAGWPDGMLVLTWHSYDPHENTAFAAVERLADGLPIIFSEFGYPSTDGADDQAEKLSALWPRYEKYYAACLFQIHDGPNAAEREHRYGIRACNSDGSMGDWKPSAFTVPEGVMMSEPIVPPVEPPPVVVEPPPVEPPPVVVEPTRPLLEVHRALSRSRMTKHPEHAKKFTILHPDGDGVLSIQPDGRIEKRPLGTTGPWETFSDDGQKACFADVTPGYTFAILLVD